MNDSFFLDTNIIVYTFDDRDKIKKRTAQALLAKALETGEGMISSQVIQEFINVATKKFAVPMSSEDASQFLYKVLKPLCVAFPSISLFKESLNVMSRTKFSFYDSLIIAAALTSGCRTLYSEDMQDGYKIEDLTIINPF